MGINIGLDIGAISLKLAALGKPADRPVLEALDAALPATLYLREPLPWEAGFLAGKSFVRYRRRRGSRTSPLPDFYIGAHAAIGPSQSSYLSFSRGGGVYSAEPMESRSISAATER